MFPCFFGMLCGSVGDQLVHSPTVQEAHVEQHDLITISMVPEDVMSKQVLSFVTFREVVRLDSALASHNLKEYFKTCLNGTLLCGAVDFRYVDWCIRRKCCARTLRITSAVNNGNHSIQAFHFEELEVRATATISEQVLCKLLTEGKDVKVLNIQFFYTMRFPLPVPNQDSFQLVEINVSGNNYVPEDALVALVSRCRLLRVINAADCCVVTRNLLLALAKHCPDLRVVHLVTWGGLNGNILDQRSTGYGELFQSCRCLQVVECSGDLTIPDMQTLADNSKELTIVTLQAKFSHDWDGEQTARVDIALTTLVQNNPHIHKLKLSNGKRFSDDSLLAVAEYLPDLQEFNLEHCQASLPGLSAIRDSCTNLTTLEVYNYGFFTTFEDPAHYPYLQLSVITTLNINSSSLSDVQLVETAKANPHIRTFIVQSEGATQSPTLITSTALCDAVSHLHNLEVFDVGTVTYENYHNRFLLRVDDTVLYTLVAHCPSLTTVSIAGHTNLSNEAISALSTLSELRILNVSQCSNLADSGVTAIAQGCPLLTDFYLSQCPHNINIGVSELARKCKNLTKVRLEACKTIRNSDIQNLIRHARHLQALNIARNPKLTFAAIAELPQYCSCMERLMLYPGSLTGEPIKPLVVEWYAAYRNNRHYFDVVFGWLQEVQ